MSHDRSSQRQRIVALVAGVFLYAAFWGLRETVPGLGITYHPKFSNSSHGEIYFWLAHAMLLFPSACLIGYGLSSWLAPGLRALWRAAADIGSRRPAAALCVIGVLGMLFFRALHHLFLFDFPITDDEYGVRFGGQLMASGMLAAPTMGLEAYISNLALHIKDGLMSSIDWPGSQAAWAIGEGLGVGGSWVFALIAAVPSVVLSLWVGRRFGGAWAAVALLFSLFSPMAFALSMTTHAHLLSRALLAVGLWLYWEAEKRQAFSNWVICGLVVGVGFFCRPFEISFIMLPFLVDLLLKIALRPEQRQAATRALLGLAVGSIGPVILLAIYNSLLSGNPLLPPRFVAGGWGDDFELASLSQPWSIELFWNRFGANSSYNLFMLSIWFLGPLGIFLVAAGSTFDHFTKLLGLGVVSALGLGLLHDDHGIHAVGPIHYSECVVALLFLSVAGLKRIVDWLRGLGASVEVLACCVASALVIGLGTFNGWNALALREQAKIQRDIYGFLEDSEISHAVVVSAQFARVWSEVPDYDAVGSWVFEWRPPRPDFSDDILIFHRVRGVFPAARAAFPDRKLYELISDSSKPFLRLKSID